MVSTRRYPKIKKLSLATEVYLHLKQDILNGTLAAGTRLLEMEIAEQMGISRAPVREALRMLEADRLVDFQVNQGAYVRKLDKDEIWEIFTARSLIEGYVASLAAKRASPEDITRLKQALENVLGAAESGDFEATVAKDFEFHRLLWEISGHRLFIEILDHLEGQIRMFMAVQAPLFAHLIDSVKDHTEIVNAIANGDSETASKTIQQHIQDAGTLMLDYWKDSTLRLKNGE
jgi:DNA-binding GntR family transcriptional regulator